MSKIWVDNVGYKVDNGVLQLMVVDEDLRSILIPHELPGGVKITALGKNFCDPAYSYDRIEISPKIAEVHEMAFADVKANEVIWPHGCTDIPPHCFSDADIKKISGIEDVINVGKGAFKGCRTGVLIWPTGCKFIPVDCFSFCVLEKIINIDSVTKIGKSAFQSCETDEFVWSSSCKTVPKECFLGGRINKISNIEHVTKIEDFAFTRAKFERFEVPRGVTVIGNRALECAKIISLELDNIKKVGAGAFGMCKDLKYVRWSNSCKVIPQECFFGCESLESIVGIDEVTCIEKGAFDRCKSLKGFKWPENCNTIPERCFSLCYKLENFDIPHNVTSIKEGAFAFSGVTSIRWPDMCKEIPDECFIGTPLTEITNIEHVTKVGSSAFLEYSREVPKEIVR